MCDVEAMYRLAVDESEVGHHAQAALIYQRLARENLPAPGQCSFHLLAADEFLEIGRTDDALAECRKAIERSPHSHVAHRLLGRTLRDCHRFTEAEVAFRQSLAICPAPTTCAYLGALLMGRNVTEAEGFFRQACELDPEFEEPHYLLGQSLAEQGKYKDAITAYREAIRLAPDYSLAHREVALAYAKIGRIADAIFHLRRCLDIDVHDEQAAETLAALQRTTDEE